MSTVAGTRRPDGPQGLGFLRLVPRLIVDPLGCFVDASRRYGDVVLFRFGHAESFLVNHPDLVRYVLKTNQENYTRTGLLDDLLPLVGNGLFTSSDSYWSAQRRMLTPAFHRRYDAAVCEAVVREVEHTLDEWRRRCAGGSLVLDMEAEMKRLMLRILIRTMFSPDVEVAADPLIQALEEVLRYAGIRGHFIRSLLQPVSKPLGLPMPGEKQARRAIGRVDAFVYDVIRQCRSGEKQSGQVLQLLLDAEAAGEIDEKQVRDELNTFLFAGFDTTAEALAWAWYLTAQHPATAECLYAEAVANHGANLTASSALGAFPFAQAVVQEALRLYPSAWAFHRRAVQADVLGGYEIYADAHVMICPYTMHRHPAFWDEPDRFRPERFQSGRDRDAFIGYHYLPFGHGGHTCIGKRVALMQAHMVVVLVARRFRLMALSPGLPTPTPDIIIKSRRPLYLRAQPL